MSTAVGYGALTGAVLGIAYRVAVTLWIRSQIRRVAAAVMTPFSPPVHRRGALPPPMDRPRTLVGATAPTRPRRPASTPGASYDL